MLVDLKTAARRSRPVSQPLYELITAETFPVQRIHVGGRSVVRLAYLLAYLGLDT